jgi:hypothetical protein
VTKEQFKQRWESTEDGGGITFDDIADCAIAWGITSTPRIKPIDVIRYQVLCSAGVVDADEYRPDNE